MGYITLWIAVVYYGENKWGMDTERTGEIYDMKVFSCKTEAQAWAEMLDDEYFDSDPWLIDKTLPCLHSVVRRYRVYLPAFGPD